MTLPTMLDAKLCNLFHVSVIILSAFAAFSEIKIRRVEKISVPMIGVYEIYYVLSSI